MMSNPNFIDKIAISEHYHVTGCPINVKHLTDHIIKCSFDFHTNQFNLDFGTKFVQISCELTEINQIHR